MFPTRVRALFSTHLRRQTAVPPNTANGGRFDMKTPQGKNNALLAGGAVATVLGGTYYMGYWDTDKAKDKANHAAASVKKE